MKLAQRLVDERVNDPRKNGAVFHFGEARLHGINWISGRRWNLREAKATRVRTCRGRRS